MKPVVAVVGSANVDLVVRTSRLPRPGETLTGEEFGRYFGGKGANQAVAAARLGAEVSFFGKVGDDPFGQEVAEALEGEGVDISYLGRAHGKPTGMAMIFVLENGENTIVRVPGANGEVDREYLEPLVAEIARAEVLLLQLEIPVPAIAFLLEELPPTYPLVILDPAPVAPLDSLRLERVEILTPNQVELASLTGQHEMRAGGKQLLEKGVRAVICKSGAEGAFLITKGEELYVPAFPVSPVDTTACGDAFNGALAVALAEGKSLPEAIRWGNAAGALAATRRGAQPSLPRRLELEALIRRD